jgi:flagellar hook protein FlgE
VETSAAGEPLFGAAGQGDLGAIQSGGLEGSNVDIAAQLVNLSTAQRNFQANAQVISTADAVTQAIINLR